LTKSMILMHKELLIDLTKYNSEEKRGREPQQLERKARTPQQCKIPTEMFQTSQ
jgi:hypothetical protein